MDYQRLVVVGGPGSGKTTLAWAVAQRLGLPHIELDGLWWQSDWTPADKDAFTGSVAELARDPAWVFDGNYFDEVAALIWPAADAVVWIDLPRAVSVWRAVRRSAGRVLRRQPLWHENRERWSVLSPSSLLRLYRRWPSYPATTSRLMEGMALREIVRLRSDAEVEHWVSGLADRTQQDTR